MFRAREREAEQQLYVSYSARWIAVWKLKGLHQQSYLGTVGPGDERAFLLAHLNNGFRHEHRSSKPRRLYSAEMSPSRLTKEPPWACEAHGEGRAQQERELTVHQSPAHHKAPTISYHLLIISIISRWGWALLMLSSCGAIFSWNWLVAYTDSFIFGKKRTSLFCA